MRKRILVRMIPDFSFVIFGSSIACLNIFYISGIEAFISSLTILGILLFISIMLGFFLNGVYSKKPNNILLQEKLLSVSKGILIGYFLCLLIAGFANLEILVAGSFDKFFPLLITISQAVSLTAIFMIGSRTWVHLYTVNAIDEINENNIISSKKNVLIIGGAGYIGSALVEKLLNEDYSIKVLDVLFFGESPIEKFLSNPRFQLIKADFRKIDDLVLAMQDCHTVIHLGGLVGDPACAIDEFLTTEVNLTSTKIIAEIAKANGVKKFIFASSCSVYGAQEEILDENSGLNPLSLYAKTKAASETVLLNLKSESFAPVILRFATVFGLSGRTRFDLVVNLLTAKACVDKNMTVFGAEQTRPFIHVSDAAESIICAMKKNRELVSGEIYNIGGSQLNYTLLELSNLIKERVPDSFITIENANEDARNYNVCFDKAFNDLSFTPKFSLEDGIDQVVNKFKRNEIEKYDSILHSNFMHMSENGRDILGSLEYVGWEKELLEAQT